MADIDVPAVDAALASFGWPMICLFVPVLRPGGAERVMVTFANALARISDERVELVTGDSVGGLRSEVDPCVCVVDLGVRRMRNAVVPLARYFRRTRPRVILSSLPEGNAAAAIGLQLSGVSSRLILREANTRGAALARLPAARRGLSYAIWLATTLLADAIIAPSSGVREDLLRMLPRRVASRIRVVPNPIDMAWISAQARGAVAVSLGRAPRIVACGRLVEAKGFDLLLDAVAGLPQPWSLTVLGEGPQRAALEQRVRNLGLSDVVAFVGMVDNPFVYFAESDVFVLSSRYEGSPNALIQALAVGTPCVATNCPSGPSDILTGRYGRYLVPPEDPAALRRAITDCLSHEKPGDHWRALVKKNDAGSVATALKALV